MNREMYTKAARYAGKLKYKDHLDLLHDAYVKWYDKTGKNLFDEPERRVFTVIRLTFMDFLKRRKSARTLRINFEEIDRSTVEFNDQKFNHITPEDEYIFKETKKNIMSLRARSVFLGNPEIPSEIAELRSFGYRNFEIAKIMGVAKSLITYYLKQIKNNLN